MLAAIVNRPEPNAPENEYCAYWERIGDIAIEICKKGLSEIDKTDTYKTQFINAEKVIWNGLFDEGCAMHNLTIVEIDDLRNDIPDRIDELLEEVFSIS